VDRPKKAIVVAMPTRAANGMAMSAVTMMGEPISEAVQLMKDAVLRMRSGLARPPW
jgi:hypothetical protein